MSEIIGNFSGENPYNMSLEEDKLVSKERFKRGYRSGLRQLFQVQVVGVPLIGGFIALAGSPETQNQIIQAINNVTPEEIKSAAIGITSFEMIAGVVSGGAMGIIDSFRPTSKLFKSHLEIDVFRDLSNAWRRTKNFEYKQKAAEAIEGTKNFIKGASSFGYAVLRPELPDVLWERKAKFASSMTRAGVAAGGFLVATSWMCDQMSTITESFGLPHSSTLDMIDVFYQKPLETITASAAVGLACAAYPLVMGRRL